MNVEGVNTNQSAAALVRTSPARPVQPPARAESSVPPEVADRVRAYGRFLAQQDEVRAEVIVRAPDEFNSGGRSSDEQMRRLLRGLLAPTDE